MAKVTDLNRAHIISALDLLIDLNGRRIFPVLSWSDFKIKFGNENSKGYASAQVIIKIYDSCMYTYTFHLIYDFVKEDWHSCPCDFKSVMIDKEFSSSHLISIDNFKINGLWHLEDVGEETAVEESAGVCPEVADDKSAISESFIISKII